MKDLFKQKLLDMRFPNVPRTFSEALLGDCSWAEKKSRIKESLTPVISDTSDIFHAGFKFTSQQVEMIFNNKRVGMVKVLFVTEKFRNWDEASLDFKSGFINDLIMAFPLKTAELFERMI